MNFIYLLSINLLLISCGLQQDLPVSPYKEINQTIHQITETEKKEIIYLKKAPISIFERTNKDFFTAEFFRNVFGQGPVLGVDSFEIDAFLKDFDFGSINLRTVDTVAKWDSKRLKFRHRIITKSSNQIDYSKKTVFSISQPLISNDNRYFFIYYDYYCGTNCGQGTVKIFKNENGSWHNILKLAVWII